MRLFFMSTNKIVTGSKKHSVSIKVTIPEKNKSVVYIYKLVYKNSKYIYIGQTTSLQRRLEVHIRRILEVIQNKQKDTPQRFHVKVAEDLLSKTENSTVYDIKKRIKNSLDFQVLSIVADKEAANFMEGHYIHRYQGDRSCLNVDKHNMYKKKKRTSFSYANRFDKFR